MRWPPGSHRLEGREITAEQQQQQQQQQQHASPAKPRLQESRRSPFSINFNELFLLPEMRKPLMALSWALAALLLFQLASGSNENGNGSPQFKVTLQRTLERLIKSRIIEITSRTITLELETIMDNNPRKPSVGRITSNTPPFMKSSKPMLFDDNSCKFQTLSKSTNKHSSIDSRSCPGRALPPSKTCRNLQDGFAPCMYPHELWDRIQLVEATCHNITSKTATMRRIEMNKIYSGDISATAEPILGGAPKLKYFVVKVPRFQCTTRARTRIRTRARTRLPNAPLSTCIFDKGAQECKNHRHPRGGPRRRKRWETTFFLDRFLISLGLRLANTFDPSLGRPHDQKMQSATTTTTTTKQNISPSAMKSLTLKNCPSCPRRDNKEEEKRNLTIFTDTTLIVSSNNNLNPALLARRTRDSSLSLLRISGFRTLFLEKSPTTMRKRFQTPGVTYISYATCVCAGEVNRSKIGMSATATAGTKPSTPADISRPSRYRLSRDNANTCTNFVLKPIVYTIHRKFEPKKGDWKFFFSRTVIFDSVYLGNVRPVETCTRWTAERFNELPPANKDQFDDDLTFDDVPSRPEGPGRPSEGGIVSYLSRSLSHVLSRVKRQSFWDIFNSDTETTTTPSTDESSEPEASNEPTTPTTTTTTTAEPTSPEVSQPHTRDTRSTTGLDKSTSNQLKLTDDEDFNAASGSGAEWETRPDSGPFRSESYVIFRIKMYVHEFWVPDYASTHSPAFDKFAKAFARELELFFDESINDDPPLPGSRRATVIGITPSRDDSMLVLVTADVGSKGFDEGDTITHRLKRHLTETSSMRAYTVKIDKDHPLSVQKFT
ncbi:unnamed protein product, partial [Nesidiocoris tenuis]